MDRERTEGPDPPRDSPREPPRVRDRRRVHLDEEPATEQASAEEEAESPQPEPSEDDALREARQQAEAYLDDLRRLKAEFENYRKRVIKEQTDLAERASEGLVARLLNVLDNFELAVVAAESSRDFDRMLKGVELVFGELKEVLASEGLTPIDAKGRKFDPKLHEAAVEVPGEDSGELHVTEVLRPGYTIKGRVLRPAMVKVRRQADA